ncbi:MAG: DNA-binding protein [Candidatus Helarchaeota archaeon]
MEDELDRLRHKRMAEMLKRIEQQKKEKELKDVERKKSNEFLTNVLLPDAYQYYQEQIQHQRPQIAQKIVDVLQYLVSSGALQYKLNREQIIMIDRKLGGIGPTIRIKRSGKEYMDIATALKKEK